jgi:hypothetical protein
LDLIKKVEVYLLNALNPKSPSITVDLLTYDTISLRTFVKIANEGDLSLLGEGSDADRVLAWEKIIQTNGKATNNMAYDSHLNLLKNYARLLSEFQVVKSALSSMLIKPNVDDLQLLAAKGYAIDAGSIGAYSETMQRAINKSTNIGSKLANAYNQLMVEKGEDNAPSATVGQLVASLNVALEGKYADIDILLCEYNEYKKLIKRKDGGRN